MEVDAAVINMKAGAHYPGRSVRLTPKDGDYRRQETPGRADRRQREAYGGVIGRRAQALLLLDVCR